MPWVILLVAVAVLVLAHFAGRGKFGAMPELVDDRPVPRLPEGDFTADDLRNLHFARPPEGYKPLQVERLLTRLAQQLEGSPLADELTSQDVVMSRFDVVHRGYSMEQVDHVLARVAQQWGRREQGVTDAAEGSGEELPDALAGSSSMAGQAPEGEDGAE